MNEEWLLFSYTKILTSLSNGNRPAGFDNRRYLHEANQEIRLIYLSVTAFGGDKEVRRADLSDPPAKKASVREQSAHQQTRQSRHRRFQWKWVYKIFTGRFPTVGIQPWQGRSNEASVEKKQKAQ